MGDEGRLVEHLGEESGREELKRIERAFELLERRLNAEPSAVIRIGDRMRMAKFGDSQSILVEVTDIAVNPDGTKQVSMVMISESAPHSESR